MNKSFKEKFDILIELFLKDKITFSWNSREWGREATACKRLLNEYSDFDFFYSIPEYYDKFNSLLGLSSAKIKNEILKKYQIFLANKKKEYILEKDSVIEIKLENKPARNVLEFIRN